MAKMVHRTKEKVQRLGLNCGWFKDPGKQPRWLLLAVSVCTDYWKLTSL
jgi:hypothetical protein